ncbi:MAG: hypothetical protein ACTHNE_17235, partial [Dyella sp.]
MKTQVLIGGLVTAALALIAPAVQAQVQTVVPPVVQGARPVIVQNIVVHSKALEGNLEGESPDRKVIVYLPPDY